LLPKCGGWEKERIKAITIAYEGHGRFAFGAIETMDDDDVVAVRVPTAVM